MQDLSLHVLDIVENSLRSNASRIEILFNEDLERDLLILEVKDDGEGMTPEICRLATDPFFTSKSGKRVGLGLSLLAQAARQAAGEFAISSAQGVGTTIRATFQNSHPDRKPLGDMAATIRMLVTAHPEVDLLYECRQGTEVARLDTREIRRS